MEQETETQMEPDDGYVVKFNDPALEKAVCDALGIKDREITK